MEDIPVQLNSPQGVKYKEFLRQLQEEKKAMEMNLELLKNSIVYLEKKVKEDAEKIEKELKG